MGREEALALVVDGVDGVVSFACRVLGAPGIGKTAFLARLREHGSRQGFRLVWVDPSSAHEARPAIGRSLSAADRSDRVVVLVDSVEQLPDLERWLACDVLPLGHPNLAVITADRRCVSPAWLDGHAAASTVVRLGPLTRAEADEYLEARDVPLTSRAWILERTEVHGDFDPSMLALACEAVRNGGLPTADDLLLQLGQLHLPAAAARQRTALQVLACSHATTHELLASCIGEAADDADALFEWLRALTILEQTAEGLRPHPLVRRELDALFRTHHPTEYARVAHAVRGRVEPAPHVELPIAQETDLSVLLPRKLAELATRAKLSTRERQVLDLVSLGRNAHEIASVLGITPRTAKFHQQRMLEKLGADSRLDILRLLM